MTQDKQAPEYLPPNLQAVLRNQGRSFTSTEEFLPFLEALIHKAKLADAADMTQREKRVEEREGLVGKAWDQLREAQNKLRQDQNQLRIDRECWEGAQDRNADILTLGTAVNTIFEHLAVKIRQTNED